MLKYLILGGGFAFAAAVQPGPLLVFLFARVAERGWRTTLPAAASPLLSDGPIAVVVLLVLRQLPAGMQQLLRAAGGILLLYLAWAAVRRWRHAGQTAPAEGASAPSTLMQAALVNITNPNPYLGWSLILGPAALEAWARGPAYAAALIGAFYGTMVVTLALIILLFGTTQFLASGGRRAVTLISALTLAALGLYQLWVSLRG
jgi:threonine/homoserine/homoserine lactone efflux protein